MHCGRPDCASQRLRLRNGHPSSATRTAIVALVTTGLGVAAHGQCTGSWIPRGSPLNIDRQVWCMRSCDPDGAGSAAPLLIIGGSLSYAGGTLPSASWRLTEHLFRRWALE